MDTYCVGRKHYDPALVQTICEEYQSGTAMHALFLKYRIASKTLRKFFLREGIHIRGIKEGINVSAAHSAANLSRRKLDPDVRARFCEEYLVGDISVEELAHKFGIHENTARKILKRQEGIFREPAHKSYVVDEAFFDVLDTPEKAYWFGFVLADGCVFGGASKGLRIGLKGSDSGHLEAFKFDIGSNHPIRLSLKRYMHKGVNRSAPACAVTIPNPHIADSLARYGCVINKTASLEPISGVPAHLFNHFVRGYFDGDGCITHSVRKNRGDYIDPNWLCVGNLPTMTYIRDGLAEVLSFSISELKFMRGCWFLRVSGVHKVSALCRFLYDCGGPFLPRKKERWEELSRLIAAKLQ